MTYHILDGTDNGRKNGVGGLERRSDLHARRYFAIDRCQFGRYEIDFAGVSLAVLNPLSCAIGVVQ